MMGAWSRSLWARRRWRARLRIAVGTTGLLGASLAMLLLSPPPAAALQFDWGRAEQNRQQVQSGQVSAAQLPPEQLEELRQYVAVLAQRRPFMEETREECIRRNMTSDAPSRLDSAALGLKCSDRLERRRPAGRR